MNVFLQNPKGIKLYRFWCETWTNYRNRTDIKTIIYLAFSGYFKVVACENLKLAESNQYVCG